MPPRKVPGKEVATTAPAGSLKASAGALARFRDGMVSSYGNRIATPGQPHLILPTGSITLDVALREGGWRAGRIHEVVGVPDVGKSTLMISSMRQAQLALPHLAVAYVDMEGTFDDDWAEANGLDLSPSRFHHMYPNHSEDASDMARNCCRSGLFSEVVLDSVGGMESKKAFEDKKGDIKDAEDELPGRNAQVITRMVKHIATLARQTNTTVLIVNQWRVVIGGFGGRTPAGPSALKHATTTQVDMSRGGETPLTLKIDGYPQTVSVQSKARVVRSKSVPVGGIAEFWINNRPTDEYGPVGINVVDEYVTRGISLGIIEQGGGGYYTAPGQEKVHGRSALYELLRSKPELIATVREKILSTSTPVIG